MTGLIFEAAVRLCLWDNEKQHDYIKAGTEYAIALTRVEYAMEKKFDRKAADDMIHALGEHTESDVDEAEFSVDGDKATVKYKGDDIPLVMRRVDGIWRITPDAFKDMSDENLKTGAEDYRKFAKLLPDIARDVESGKYATATDAIEIVKHLLSPPAPPNPKAGP